MLRQSDGYLSGQQLCDHFQVSRTAVWKAINQLKEEGYEKTYEWALRLIKEYPNCNMLIW